MFLTIPLCYLSYPDGANHISFFSLLFCSSDTEFSITLNSKDALTEDEKTLASYGIVPGDLICLLLEEKDAKPSLPPPSSSNPPTLQNGHETSTVIPSRSQADSPKEERPDGQSANQKAQEEVQSNDDRVRPVQCKANRACLQTHDSFLMGCKFPVI